MLRVLIVEDDPSTRDYFAACVETHPALALAGCLADATSAIAWLDAPANRVDVLLTDLGLPDGSGLQVIRHAARVRPQCECLVISVFGDEENVLASIEAGALGYIHKDSPSEDVAQAILEMRAGGSPISPMIARRVLGRLRPVPAAAAQPASAEPGLSAREQEVLELIARGFSYAEIAKLHALSVHTVQSHIKNLYRKLAVSSRSEAVYEAMQLGLLRRP
ncbi:MAG TPA: response regulator transcription factor [Ramlibacter sp.]|nr:response regulator transcription factor [Ramlibacter sp.]